MKDIYLGIDASTSVVGLSAIDKDNNIVFAEGFDLKTKDNEIESKAIKLFNKLHEIKKEYNVIVCGIEDNLNSYRQTSNKTIIKLAKINGITTFQLMIIFGGLPYRWHPTTARKLALGRGFDKEHYDNTKEFVLNEIINIFTPEVISEYLYENKNGKIKPECYDAMDAIVLAIATKKEYEKNGKDV